MRPNKTQRKQEESVGFFPSLLGGSLFLLSPLYLVVIMGVPLAIFDLIVQIGVPVGIFALLGAGLIKAGKRSIGGLIVMICSILSICCAIIFLFPLCVGRFPRLSTVGMGSYLIGSILGFIGQYRALNEPPSPKGSEVVKQRPALFAKTKYLITLEKNKLTLTSYIIKDAENQPLGKLKIRELQNSGIRFFNNEGEQVGEIKRHQLSFRTQRSVLNWNGEKVGDVKQKLSTFFTPEYWFEDLQGEKILHIQGDFRHYTYDFFDNEERKVAEVSNVEEGIVVRLTEEGKQQEIDSFLLLSAVFAVATATKWGFLIRVIGATTLILFSLILPLLLFFRVLGLIVLFLLSLSGIAWLVKNTLLKKEG